MEPEQVEPPPVQFGRWVLPSLGCLPRRFPQGAIRLLEIPMRTTTRLKEIVARRAAVQAPGAANALFARVIEELGFEVVYVTGAGIANMHVGAPDIGLTTLSEIADAVSAMADAVALPLI